LEDLVDRALATEDATLLHPLVTNRMAAAGKVKKAHIKKGEKTFFFQLYN